MSESGKCAVRAEGDGHLCPPIFERALLVVTLVLSVLLAFWNLDIPLQGSEGRWAVVCREMTTSGDPFSMTIAGRPYLDKPFGSYWLILLTAKITGNMSEFTLRLPSVISYLLTVALIYVIGKRTVGAREGALAAFIYATMFRILFFSREASADAQTVLGIALALLLALEAGEKPRWHMIPLIGLVMGVSSQMKGLSGFATPCFVVFLWCVFVRGFRWLRPVPVLLGVLVFAVTLLAPFMIAHAQQGTWKPLEMLWHESETRFVMPFDHRQPWYFYFWNQFELLSPWSAFLPSAIILWIARVRAQAGARGGYSLTMFDQPEERRQLFPFFCYLAIFLFFTLSGSRRTYYLMPAVPFASLVVAQVLLANMHGRALRFRRAIFWISAAAVTLAGAAALFVGCLRLSLDRPPGLLSFGGQITPELWRAVPPWLVLSGAAVVFGVAIGWRMLRNKPALLPLLCVIAIAALTMVGMLERLRAVDDSLPRFGSEVSRIVPPGECIEMTDADFASMVYYVEREPALVAKRPTRFRIIYASWLPRLHAQGNYIVRCRQYEDEAPGSPAHSRNFLLVERVD